MWIEWIHWFYNFLNIKRLSILLDGKQIFYENHLLEQWDLYSDSSNVGPDHRK